MRRPNNDQPEGEEGNRDVLAGVHAITEAFRAGRQLEKVLVDRDMKSNDRLQELYDLCRRSRIPVQKVPYQALDRIARGHQGVVAYVAPFEYLRLSEAIRRVTEQGIDPFIMILDGVTDVRNAGALARSGEGAGMQIMVVPMLGTAQLGAEAFKASSGAFEHIYVCREANLDKTIPWLREQGIKTVAVTEKANKDIFFADLTGPIALVMGSEEKGISDDVLTATDVQVKLPMQGQIESLNVAAAGAVACFEVLRQRMGVNKA
ncbi:23S rRNA (guanosine(2251)-2'-O)-methyltransferase RlmB [Nostoc sp. NIES-2111]